MVTAEPAVSLDSNTVLVLKTWVAYKGSGYVPTVWHLSRVTGLPPDVVRGVLEGLEAVADTVPGCVEISEQYGSRPLSRILAVEDADTGKLTSNIALNGIRFLVFNARDVSTFDLAVLTGLSMERVENAIGYLVSSGQIKRLWN